MTRRPLSLLAAFAVALAACGGGTAATTTTTTAPTTTTTTSTTTTTTTTTLPPTTTSVPETTVTAFPAEFASPLNGLAADDLRLDRGVIAIKIDNHPDARPQSGLLEADAMLETLVEGGFTRFIALFHDNEAELIGPIRSLRPTDSTLVLPLAAPLFISGGQSWIQSLTVSRGVRILGESAGMFRSSLHSAPHNLYGDTETLRAAADARGYTADGPAGLLPIDDWPYPDETATEIVLDWSSNTTSTWRYDEATRTYLRWTNGREHYDQDADRNRTQLAYEVLVVLAGNRYTASPSGEGSSVPAIDTVGSGPAWVFARGRVWVGTWERSGMDEPFTLISSDGSAAPAPAGTPWISVFPEGRPVTYSG